MTKTYKIRYQEIVAGKSEGIGGDQYYGYMDDLKNRVEQSFKDFGLEVKDNNVTLVKGLYEDTLSKKDKSPVAFAHIDCDWYDSVMVCLERITPRLSTGGVMIIDDYDAWSGCKKAVDDYFEDKKDKFVFRKLNRLHIERITV